MKRLAEMAVLARIENQTCSIRDLFIFTREFYANRVIETTLSGLMMLMTTIKN